MEIVSEFSVAHLEKCCLEIRCRSEVEIVSEFSVAHLEKCGLVKRYRPGVKMVSEFSVAHLKKCCLEIRYRSEVRTGQRLAKPRTQTKSKSCCRNPGTFSPGKCWKNYSVGQSLANIQSPQRERKTGF